MHLSSRGFSACSSVHHSWCCKNHVLSLALVWTIVMRHFMVRMSGKKTLRNSSMSEQWSTNRLCRKLTTTKSTATTLLVVCSVRNWLQTSNIVLQVADDRGSLFTSMGVSSCSSLGWPAGGHICIWGGARIPEVLMHDWVNGVIWHQLCDATLCVQLLCNLATLQPVSLGEAQKGGHISHMGRAPGHPLELPLFI